MKAARRTAVPACPPFPEFPAPEDWHRAARSIYEPIPSPFGRSVIGGCILFLDGLTAPPRVPYHDDPLGRLVAAARDCMRTRHCRTPAYTAFLAECERQRLAALAAEEATRQRRERERSAKDRAEEEAFYADGGTAEEWADQQEAKEEARAAAAAKRKRARARSKATPAPRRKATTTTTTTKETQ